MDQIWYEEKTITVDENVILSGDLVISPTKTRNGQVVELTYSVHNLGNKDYDNIPVQFLFIDGLTQEMIESLPQTLTVSPGVSINDILPVTIDLPDTRYMVVMQAEIDGETVPLANAGLTVDSTPPVTEYNLSEQQYEQNGILYGVKGSAFTLTAADNLSGVAETRYDLGQDEFIYIEPIVFTAGGVYTIHFYSIDRLGNEEAKQDLTIVIDATLPTVSIVSPVNNAEVGTEFSVAVEMEDQVGIDHGELYVGNEKVSEINDSSVTIWLSLAPGNYTLKARAINQAGLESWSEPVEITVVNLDVNPPVTTANYPTDWLNIDAEVLLTATDDASGVKETLYRIGDGSWSTGNIIVVADEGVIPVKFYSVDNAGNVENTQSLSVKVDKTAPITQASYPTNWVNADVIVTFNADDSLSGVKETRYKVGNSEWQVGEVLTVSNVGTHNIEFYSMDNAENEESIQNITVRIDKTAPITEVTLTGEELDDGSYKDQVTVVLNAADDVFGAGVAGIYYRIGTTGEYKLYEEAFVIKQTGMTIVSAYAVDAAGNQEEPVEFGVQVIQVSVPDITLLAKKLTLCGNTEIDSAFVNGLVKISGSSQINYLGTTESYIVKNGPSQINTLELRQVYRLIPTPDWCGLSKVTVLQKDKKITSKRTIFNMQFNNDLKISGPVKLKGIIVVKGDLDISGNAILDNAGIFCSGKVTITGNVKGTGLIYAGNEFIAHGNPQIHGAIIVDGPATITGRFSYGNANIGQYFSWLKYKSQSKTFCSKKKFGYYCFNPWFKKPSDYYLGFNKFLYFPWFGFTCKHD